MTEGREAGGGAEDRVDDREADVLAEGLAGDEMAGATAGRAEDRADECEADELAEGFAGDEIAGAAVGAAEDRADERKVYVLVSLAGNQAEE